MLRTIAAAALALAALPAAAAQDRPDRKPFLDLYRELVETNTVVNVGSCTRAAAQVAARMKAAGFADADLIPFSVPEHPKDGGLVAVMKGSDPSVKPMLLLGHLDVVEAKREDGSAIRSGWSTRAAITGAAARSTTRRRRRSGPTR